MDTVSYDPFGWRLAELASVQVDEPRCAQILEQLLVCEAEELAHGRRHLTAVHGCPHDLAEVVALDEFYDEMFDLLVDVDDVRLAGGDAYLTITVPSGSIVLLDALTDAAQRRGWRVVDGPLP